LRGRRWLNQYGQGWGGGGMDFGCRNILRLAMSFMHIGGIAIEYAVILASSPISSGGNRIEHDNGI
jgi:hypothetical protein